MRIQPWSSPREVHPLGDLGGNGLRPFRKPLPGKHVHCRFVDADTLRAKQAPLKARYRGDPSAALITLRAEGTLGHDGVACSVATGRALVEAGLHPSTGGTGVLACSGDMLLQALVACAGVTMSAVATAMGWEVGGSVHAEGDLDVRGTLGVKGDERVPVGFRTIRLVFDLDHTAGEDDLVRLLDLPSATASCTRRWSPAHRSACRSGPAPGRWSRAQAAARDNTRMKGPRYLLRNLTALAVKEHLRSQVERTADGALTPNEADLVRFATDRSDRLNDLAARSLGR